MDTGTVSVSDVVTGLCHSQKQQAQAPPSKGPYPLGLQTDMLVMTSQAQLTFD